jgi:hypothetical protein
MKKLTQRQLGRMIKALDIICRDTEEIRELRCDWSGVVKHKLLSQIRDRAKFVRSFLE